MALVFLGEGFKPVVEKYLVSISAHAFYWINIVSAILDNATLTAAEMSPAMPLETIKELLLGLLIAGGMLIPGNIPNIICAGKLSIKSKEWAKFGVPVGLVIMIGVFIIILFADGRW
jgi:predicted cation transporter